MDGTYLINTLNTQILCLPAVCGRNMLPCSQYARMMEEPVAHVQKAQAEIPTEKYRTMKSDIESLITGLQKIANLKRLQNKQQNYHTLLTSRY